MLFVQDGAVEREIELSHTPFTMGRLPDRDLVLPYAYISRNHAHIVEEDGQFFLVDQGSQSGTYVNGQKVDRRAITAKDVIHLGSIEGPKIQLRGKEATTHGSLRMLLGQMQDSSGSESSLAKLGWFVEAARKLNNVGAVHEILSALIETTLQLTRAERGYVFLRDRSGKLQLAAGRNMRNEALVEDSTISHSAISQAMQSGSEFIVTDTLSAEANAPSQSMMAQNLRTIICIPLRKRSVELREQEGETLGALYLDSRQQRGKLTRIDSDLLKIVATEAAVLVENAALAEAEEAGRRYREELKIASEIQQGLMMVRIPELSYAKVKAQSLPCKGIGGDFYDVIAVEGGLYVVLADISGKGVSAALLASTLQGMIHAQALAGQSLTKIAALTNRYICGKDIGKYATMVLLRLSDAGDVEYINCGHVPPQIHRSDGVKSLGNSNLPIGLIASAEYASDNLRMEPGDRIFIVTDGVTEAECPEGECYGDERLQALVMGGGGILEVIDEVSVFTHGAPLEDDCTILEVCYAACF